MIDPALVVAADGGHSHRLAIAIVRDHGHTSYLNFWRI
jgi:hypothetical protein